MPESVCRRARLRVSKELLISALHLSGDTEILDIRNSDDFREVEMIVSHPNLPAVEGGNALPLANPLISDHRLILESWGI